MGSQSNGVKPVRTRSFGAASAIALACLSAPAVAQMQMPGMKMPGMKMPGMKMPMATKPTVKSAAKKLTRKHAATRKQVARAKRRTAKTASLTHHAAKRAMTMSMPTQPHEGGQAAMPMDHSQVQSRTSPMPMPAQPQMGTMPMASPTQPQKGAEMQMPMQPKEPSGGMTMGQSPGQTSMSHMSMSSMPGHGAREMQMTGALGTYPGQRESSGTAWQPDASEPMNGIMLMPGEWTLMAHGTLNLVFDHQSGSRGADKAFVNGMLMGMARRPLGNGSLQFRAMFSPDPLMGPAGYPLLLATGETANGTTALVNRQHPHDFFMELSASVSQNIGPRSSIFFYAGLPGEPAFGPPAFMHREAILDSPEAPISHHWLDSTHITFGVVTAGIVLDRFKLEASEFNAREPDQHRWDIETGPLDSTSLRISWNATRTLALQASWARFKDPEQLEPGVNQTRWSASALWADDLAPGWHAAATLAWGRKSSDGHDDDAIAAEGSLKHDGWTLFGRGEEIQNRELLGLVGSPAYKVGKISLGVVRDFKIGDHLAFGAGGLFSLNFVPDALSTLYASHHPTGMMAFVRLKLH